MTSFTSLNATRCSWLIILLASFGCFAQDQTAAVRLNSAPAQASVVLSNSTPEVSAAVIQSNSTQAAQIDTNLTKELITIELGGEVKMEFVRIPAGSFQMGSERNPEEKPVHTVTIAKPFYFSKYLVTQEQWDQLMGGNRSSFKGLKNPVDSVSWNDCQNFVAKLKEIAPRQTFRLPTEAEWEYACRAGSDTEFNWGDSEAVLSEYAWDRSDSGLKTHPVGEKKPNAWGLYDMPGNVWEWCQDLWHLTYAGAPSDGSVWMQDGDTWYRVLRGGSWNNSASSLRAARRVRNLPGLRLDYYGFRVVLTEGTP